MNEQLNIYPKLVIELSGDNKKIIEGLKKLYELGLKIRRIE